MKFQFQIKTPEHVYIENHEAKSWEDIRVMHIKGNLDEDDKRNFAEAYSKTKEDGRPWPLIVFGDTIDIDVYELVEATSPEQLTLELWPK